MSYYLTFKGLDSTQFGVEIMSDNRPILPDNVRITKQVPGVPGSIDFGLDTASEKIIPVSLRLDFNGDLTYLNEQCELISGWLYDDGNYYDLIFSDRPDRKYKAKVASIVDTTKTYATLLISISFICNPPFAFALDNTPVSPADIQAMLLWDSATLDGLTYYQNFSVNGNMNFTVTGNVPTKPIIELIGYIPAGLTLTYNGLSWIYTQAVQWDSIIIDCNLQTVTKGSDGTNLFPYVDANNDNFFVLQPGSEQFIVTGIAGAYPYNLSIILKLEPIYGG